MSTTTDEATILEDQPTQSAAADHPARPVHAPLRTRPRRTALRWVGGGIVASAAAVASVMSITDADTSVQRVEVPEGTTLADDATELDVRGIPTSWSQQGGAPRSTDATELDVRGVPTWWSAGAPAP